MTRAAVFLAAFLAAGVFCVLPVSAQTKSKEDRDAATEERKAREKIDREVRDACAKARRAYEAAKAVYEGRKRRGASDELMEEAEKNFRAAARDYYRCLGKEYYDRGIVILPREFWNLWGEGEGEFRGANWGKDPFADIPEPCAEIVRREFGKPRSEEEEIGVRVALCECLEKHAPDLWAKMCRGGSDSDAPFDISKGASGGSKPGEPPPPPLAPPAPGTGRVGGGRAPADTPTPPSQVAVPTPTPTSAVVPPPAPTEVSLAPCAPEGAASDVMATVVRHLDNHDHTWCGQYLNRRIRALFTQVLASSLLLTLQGLPSPLTCSISPPGCAGTCEATFAQLAGQTNVTVRLELTLRNGQVQQGRLVFAFPGQPFEVALAPAN